MMFVFFCLFLVELWGLIQVGGALGVGVTLLWVVFSILLGIAMLRTAGVSVLIRLSQTGLTGEADRMVGVLSEALIFAGGLALIVPGLLSDLFGLLCWWPLSRQAIARFILGRSSIHSLFVRYSSRVPFAGRSSKPTIDAEWRDDQKD